MGLVWLDSTSHQSKEADDPGTDQNDEHSYDNDNDGKVDDDDDDDYDYDGDCDVDARRQQMTRLSAVTADQCA